MRYANACLWSQLIIAKTSTQTQSSQDSGSELYALYVNLMCFNENWYPIKSPFRQKYKYSFASLLLFHRHDIKFFPWFLCKLVVTSLIYSPSRNWSSWRVISELCSPCRWLHSVHIALTRQSSELHIGYLRRHTLLVSLTCMTEIWINSIWDFCCCAYFFIWCIRIGFLSKIAQILFASSGGTNQPIYLIHMFAKSMNTAQCTVCPPV